MHWAGGGGTCNGHQIGGISTIFSCNCIICQQEVEFDTKLNMMGIDDNLVATK
jgi:hypothetical protein